MSQKVPGYLTPEEFAELVVVSLEESGHFRRKERVHPEDLAIAFTTQAKAVALGVAFSITQARKNAILTETDLKKSIEQDVDVNQYHIKYDD